MGRRVLRLFVMVVFLFALLVPCGCIGFVHFGPTSTSVTGRWIGTYTLDGDSQTYDVTLYLEDSDGSVTGTANLEYLAGGEIGDTFVHVHPIGGTAVDGNVDLTSDFSSAFGRWQLTATVTGDVMDGTVSVFRANGAVIILATTGTCTLHRSPVQ